MKPSESEFLDIRGLRYHFRCWGDTRAPKVFMLHGWMDVSASFQFVADALRREWRVIAPDWRGFGLSEWAKGGSYWFPDYFADLERLLDHFQRGGAVNLVGHSMGGNIATIYAGIRPSRVAKLVNLEGYGLAAVSPELAAERYARWLDELAEGPSLRDYDSFDALAARLRRNNPRLSESRAAFLARHWGRQNRGRIELASDPRHKLVNPVLYRTTETYACWRRVTAPVLWVSGAETKMLEVMKLSASELAERKACLRNLSERVIPDAGHMLHHDQPERLAEIIEGFLG